jgi:signal transduction histidine kinase
MSNAVRHAQASSIDVHCVVHAPEALITVSDNGRGLQAARSTSHGLHIMKERALLIGAVLEIGETAAGGLSVTVRLPGYPESDDSTVPDITHEKVTA